MLRRVTSLDVLVLVDVCHQHVAAAVDAAAAAVTVLMMMMMTVMMTQVA